MYLFIYKTTHKNGKFYIGRHETDNLNDGYLGSGKWVKSIKDRSNLDREIIEYSDNIDNLKTLEEYYIEKHWNDPLCMNVIRGSDGWTSKDVSVFNSEIQENGKSRSQNRATNMYLSGKSGLVSDGGKNIVYKMTEEGTNPFFKRDDGSSVASDRVKNGTHNLVGGVTCTDIKGNIIQVPKKEYYSQKGEMNSWKYVSITSNEGRRRTGKKDILLVSCVDENGIVKRIPKSIYDSQRKEDENKQWVSSNSKEGKRRKQLNSMI